MIELTVKLVLLVIFWALLASPLLIAAFMTGRAMQRRNISSMFVTVPFALIVAFLAAPVPTPIITVFIPNGLALFDGDFFAAVFGKNDFLGQLRPWFVTSIVTTSAITCSFALRYITFRKPTPVSGKPDA